MSRETISEVRIWCDGCGLTYLEIQTSVEIDAKQRCGWVSRERNGGRQDLCPACRPDSPFEAEERVRALAEHAMSVVSRGCTCPGDDCTGKCRRGEPMGWDLDPVKVLAALDGESDG